MTNSTERRVEYSVTYLGEVIQSMGPFSTKIQAMDYVAAGVMAGNPAEHYGIVHRMVTVTPWAPTTMGVAR